MKLNLKKQKIRNKQKTSKSDHKNQSKENDNIILD